MESTNTSNVTEPEKPVFEGNPFKCRVVFTRGTNPSALTIVSPKTNLAKGDLFVISLNDDDTQKLVMQVDRLDDERLIQSPHPEIHIDESIKKTFSVISFMMSHYMVQKIANKQPFSLYLVEIQVKEQYLSRGDMWRFARKLHNTTVYLKKTLDIFGMRATVYGLWIPEHPYRVSSGYITKDTKIVFRSLSACCTIFLQMSKEMWDFDHQGDTYYEKAVDGFLFDLFTRWKTMSCQHDVTMTLFSRVFYDAKSLDDFPESLRRDINKDHRGRFYEDFYRVIYQNERYDDWTPRLAKIKQVLVNYKDDLVNYHKKQLSKSEADKMPNGTISSAADGNYLETLNLSASVFERHFIDRPFDRLGQMSLVITPGAGVFEVDRELTNMTKQRVLDNGIGSDLVCLGEQPLFAVPLFKFFKADLNTADDYQIPHWMNLSYYHTSTVKSSFKRFIPRLSFNPNRIKGGMLDVKNVMNSITEEIFSKPVHLSMEEYDAQVFRTTTTTKGATEQACFADRVAKGEARKARRRNITMGPTHPVLVEEEEPSREPTGMLIINNKIAGINEDLRIFNTNIKDDIVLSTSHATSANISGYLSYNNAYNQSPQVLFYPQSFSRAAAQSADTYFLTSHLYARMQPRPKALTNPFAPASIRIPMVPGRRRWAHTFPIGPNKIPWHFHHLREIENAVKREIIASITTCAHLVLPGTSKRITNSLKSKRINQHSKTTSEISSRPKRIVSPSNFEMRRDTNERKDSFIDDNRTNVTNVNTKKSNADSSSKPKKEKSEAIIWGPTGVEPWSASMITGIDWKSLSIPASLPTTFDVAPLEEYLKHDYTYNSYQLLAILPPLTDFERKRKHVHTGSGNQEKLILSDPLERHKLVFDELIDHRLSQGFQVIMEIPPHIEKIMIEKIRLAGHKPTDCNRLLNIGRIYHTISLITEENRSQDTVVITVQQFKPQYVFQPKPVHYKYRYQCPDSSYYDPAKYDLQIESLESVGWNILDDIVCTHGTGGYKLSDTMKYWRTRLVLMPVSRDYTIKNIESGQTKCDSRQEMSHEDFFLYVEHFIRFLVMLNKLTHIRTGSNEFFHRPLDPLTNTKRIDCHKRPAKHSTSCKTFKLTDIISENTSSINSFLALLRDEQQGLPFVKDSILPEYSFIAIEAIWWSMEHCEDIQDEKTALLLFRTLCERGYIRHCTRTENLFRFGFFLYFIVADKTRNFRLDSNDYAEVEFHQTQNYIPSMDYLGFGECKPMRLLPKLIDNPQSIPRTTRLGASNVNGNINFTTVNGNISSTNVNGNINLTTVDGNISSTNVNENINSTNVNNTTEDDLLIKQEVPSIILKRSCNVDVDPKHISDRREWAVAQHHAYYNPHCLFELEIRWLVSTSCILGDLITNWSQRTGTILDSNHVAFHLIPIPCDPFAEFDPLRGPIYIKMETSCLSDKLADLPEEDRVLQLNIFQELIVKRYGFILNACVSYKDENIYYVHISGGMLVYILSDVYNVHCNRRSIRVASSGTGDGQSSPLDCGFYWCWNFCLGKRWRSSQTGEEKYQDIMLADFRAFCANDKDRLVSFWNEVNKLANKEMAEKQQTQENYGDN
ncbi:unnamed protein product [Adineta steineri]|uniref:DEP domain-containing protein n=1 Tax=Adineta steineri TaxID=433720 RepID=A0A819I797_9BILA|nr:unnamed protein product [Adineta steineri]